MLKPGELAQRIADHPRALQVNVRVGDRFYFIGNVYDVGEGRSLILEAEVPDGEESRTGTWAQDVSDGAPTVRAGSVIEVRDPG